MNIKTKLLAVSIIIASSNAFAETDHDICSAISTFSKTIMSYRHKGLSMADAYANVDTQMYRDMVLAAYSEPLYTSQEYIDRSVNEFGNKNYMYCINGGINELKRQIDERDVSKSESDQIVKSSAYTASWGNGITAVVSTEVCKDPEFLIDGYVFAIDSGIAQSKLKRKSDAYYTSKGVAYTVQGCWKAVPNYKEGAALAKFKRKHDGKITYQEIDFKDGSWTKL